MNVCAEERSIRSAVCRPRRDRKPTHRIDAGTSGALAREEGCMVPPVDEAEHIATKQDFSHRRGEATRAREETERREKRSFEAVAASFADWAGRGSSKTPCIRAGFGDKDTEPPKGSSEGTNLNLRETSVLVETTTALLPQPSRGDHPTQQDARAVLGVASLLLQHLHNAQARVKADAASPSCQYEAASFGREVVNVQIRQGQRTHRMPHSQLERRVNIFLRRHSLKKRERRVISSKQRVPPPHFRRRGRKS